MTKCDLFKRKLCRNLFCGILLIGCFSFTACYPQQSRGTSSYTAPAKKIQVIITSTDGKTTTSKTIDGDIEDKSVIERFAKNLGNRPGYTYVGGFWNDAGQFAGVVNTPAGQMLFAIKNAD